MFLSIVVSGVFAEIPAKPNPQKLVNDFTGTLTENQALQLETKLVAFNDSTSVQIAVVIVATLDGYDKADYAQRLGQSWGVGGSKFDNGFVILVKPKTNEEPGQVFIATGYGVEQYVTDATAKEIVDIEMLPFFRQNDYFGGINASVDAIIGLVTGKFSQDKYQSSKNQEGGGIVIIILIIVVALIIIFSRNNNNHHTIDRTGGGGGPVFFPWTGGGSSGRGGFGGFSGGSSGGFGGFGGGSFGGGGAGGSW
jgi:uncharacterized protein